MEEIHSKTAQFRQKGLCRRVTAGCDLREDRQKNSLCFEGIRIEDREANSAAQTTLPPPRLTRNILGASNAQIKGHHMDKVTRYEWQGSSLILILLCLPGITIPIAVVYYMNNLLRIETEVPDAEKLADFLRDRSGH
jgi:hypothetical protein